MEPVESDWPKSIHRALWGNFCPKPPTETYLYGIYNKILSFLFNTDDTFFNVVPHFLKSALGPSVSSGSASGADRSVVIEVHLDTEPLFLLQLNGVDDLKLPSARHAADERIRNRMLDLAATCPIRQLNAISAFGTKMRFYALDTRKHDAEIIPIAHSVPEPNSVKDAIAESMWDVDLMDPGTEAKLSALVEKMMDDVRYSR